MKDPYVYVDGGDKQDRIFIIFDDETQVEWKKTREGDGLALAAYTWRGCRITYANRNGAGICFAPGEAWEFVNGRT